MINRWWGKRAARGQWEAGLAWFRLRYAAAEGPTRCIKLLSRPQACGRIALYFQPGATVAALYLGVPQPHVRLLRRMAADFRFSLQPLPPDVSVPAPQPLTPAVQLPWRRPFMAQIVNEGAFVSLLDAEAHRGDYWPPAMAETPADSAPSWRFPSAPPPGVTTQPTWRAPQPPAWFLSAAAPRPWLLGRAQTGVALQVGGRINLYGHRTAVADWLVRQLVQQIGLDPTNLVILDGAGDLAPQLKRQAAITRLLGARLAYVDIDGTSLADGLNPLAPVPGETESALLQRWQRWFSGMHVHPQGVALLAQARQAGVEDIPSLQKWLQRAARRGSYAAVSSLGLALNRLTASRSLREWLEWPVNRFEILPGGALLFACKGTGWDRQQLLQAMLLAVAPLPDVRIVVHGFPWKQWGVGLAMESAHLLVANGPPLPEAVTVLVQTDAARLPLLAQRYLRGDAFLTENLALLGRGEGIGIDREAIFPITWRETDDERVGKAAKREYID